jgi:hypothetical protein
MIAYIQVQPTAVPETFRVDLENHTDTLRVSELYSRNTGMDDDRYPDYKSEHEIISQILAGITSIKGIISQAKVASRKYDEELDDYVNSTGWVASFKLYNQTFNYIGIEHQETPEEDQELPAPPTEIEVKADEDSDPIGDSGPEPGELLIIPPDIGTDSKPWGEWVRDTCPGCFEPAKHFGKPVYFYGDDGTFGHICNVDLAYKFKNLGDNPNLLNSCPEAFNELRAELGISYYFENKNETSE